MNGLEIMFDGINIQEAGELLLNQPESTYRLRFFCRDSYYRSLEEFAFAAIFGSRIVTTDKLPDVCQAYPGETLLDAKNPHFGKKHDRRPRQRTASWEGLLDDPVERGKLGQLLSSLNVAAGGMNRRFWTQQVLREVFQYLGDHESLRTPKGHSPYQFKGRGQFVHDVELQGLVPPEYAMSIVQTIRTIEESSPGALPGVTLAHDEALSEFVTRNALAHLGIYRWYNHIREEVLSEDGVRVPHATRQSLPSVEQNLWKVLEITMPGLLAEIIAKSSNRNDVLDQLVEAAFNSKYDSIREKLALAVHEFRTGNRQELTDLKDDIEKTTRLWAEADPQTRCILIGRENSDYEKALGTLARAGAGRRENRRIPDCSKVFPELYDKKPLPLVQVPI